VSRESERLRLVTNTLLSVGVAGRDGIPVPVQLRREEIVSVLDDLAAALARVARLEAAAQELLTGVLPTPSEARCTVYTDDVKDLRAALEREP